MKTLRRRIFWFASAVAVMAYWRDYPDKLYAWSVIAGLAVAFVMTCMGPGKYR